jgi:hypothetical protein
MLGRVKGDTLHHMLPDERSEIERIGAGDDRCVSADVFRPAKSVTSLI